MFNINAARMPATVQPVVTVLGPHGNVHANVITTDHGIYRIAWAPTHAGKQSFYTLILKCATSWYEAVS